MDMRRGPVINEFQWQSVAPSRSPPPPPPLLFSQGNPMQEEHKEGVPHIQQQQQILSSTSLRIPSKSRRNVLGKKNNNPKYVQRAGHEFLNSYDPTVMISAAISNRTDLRLPAERDLISSSIYYLGCGEFPTHLFYPPNIYNAHIWSPPGLRSD